MLVLANKTTPKTTGVVHPPSPLPGGARGWDLHVRTGPKHGVFGCDLAKNAAEVLPGVTARCFADPARPPRSSPSPSSRTRRNAAELGFRAENVRILTRISHMP